MEEDLGRRKEEEELGCGGDEDEKDAGLSLKINKILGDISLTINKVVSYLL